ncbi:MAG: two pore domain potassium channel family protein [Proteobacteria bacterium]|nr:two pore domain potassium channel family protein [Pseudomonadota bacterium]
MGTAEPTAAEKLQKLKRRTRTWVWGTLFGSGAVVFFSWLLAPAETLEGRSYVAAWGFALINIVPATLLFRAYFVKNIRPAETVIALLAHGVLVIGSFAGIYDANLIKDCADLLAPVRQIYFSMVTFTTLGYGDCKPTNGVELIAAFEALFSYAFFGAVVGTVATLGRR